MNIEENIGGREHWEKIYSTKSEKQLSWFQDYPSAAMKFIDSFHLPSDVSIIDIGSGDGRFIDALLEKGYRNISALDISPTAIERAKKRLGQSSQGINWIVSDIANFQPAKQFDLWHDRAAFHFLTSEEEINRYISIAEHAIKSNGYLLISTFSDQGPKRCSGLDTRQYSEASLTASFNSGFEKLHCLCEDHITPSGTIQNFLFCSFKRR